MDGEGVKTGLFRRKKRDFHHPPVEEDVEKEQT